MKLFKGEPSQDVLSAFEEKTKKRDKQREKKAPRTVKQKREEFIKELYAASGRDVTSARRWASLFRQTWKWDDANERGRKSNSVSEVRALERGLEQAVKQVETPNDLNLRAVVGNLTLGATGVFAWFTLRARTQGFAPLETIEDAILSDAVAYSQLAGRTIKIRTTNRPYSPDEWARATYEDAHEHGKPLPAFNDYLAQMQDHLFDSSFEEKWVYVGVQLAGFLRYPSDLQREARFYADEAATLADKLAASSLRARPASPVSMQWLLEKSLKLGLPVPEIGPVGDYGAEDMAELAEGALWTHDPVSNSITVTARVAGEAAPITRHVRVLTLGRIGPQEIPQDYAAGWMQKSDRLPFPVEWAATVEIKELKSTKKEVESSLLTIRDQWDHYVEDHDMQPPPTLERQYDLVRQIDSDLDTEHGGVENRSKGWYRVALSADSIEQLDARTAEFASFYGEGVFSWIPKRGQYHNAREFIPGEPLSDKAHSRRLNMAFLAAGIPQGTAEIGDKCGAIIGPTAGNAARAVAWDMFADMERRHKSGLAMLVAGLGGGKTFLAAWLLYQAVLSGAYGVIFDPSDRLGRLAELPQLKDYTEYVNLLNGAPGLLSPFYVVAEPKRDWFESEDLYREAILNAREERRTLFTDCLRMFLSDQKAKSDNVATVIERLAELMPMEANTPPGMLFDILERIASNKEETTEDLLPEHRIEARNMLVRYRRLSRSAIGRLVFPPEGTPVPSQDQDDKRRLIIYTVNGIVPEDREGNSNLVSDRDRLGTVVFTLAAYLTQGQIYRAKRLERKVLLLDESSVLRSIPSGKALMDKSSTDSRKNNLRVLAVGQNVSQYADQTRTNALDNLVGAAFVGAMQGSEIGPALSLVKAPQGQGYEAIISSLRPAEDRRETNAGNTPVDDQLRQFVFWDGDGTERIFVDANGQPEFKEMAQTGPDQIRLQENAKRLAAAMEAAAESPATETPETGLEDSEAPRRLRRQPREEYSAAYTGEHS
ncbi:ATP-binding protein [Paenarthrobacter sp. NPDC090522]|uniref:ATP-binding protein n=1 Tax=Paenarthrobacter sp. NPDC090522 TaxID=3364383 RepID=UPI0037FFD569